MSLSMEKPSEMQQISDATGGIFQEVTAAEDLQDTFNTFYDLIYGTSSAAGEAPAPILVRPPLAGMDSSSSTAASFSACSRIMTISFSPTSGAKMRKLEKIVERAQRLCYYSYICAME